MSLCSIYVIVLRFVLMAALPTMHHCTSTEAVCAGVIVVYLTAFCSAVIFIRYDAHSSKSADLSQACREHK